MNQNLEFRTSAMISPEAVRNLGSPNVGHEMHPAKRVSG